MTAERLAHLDDSGNARMVNVTAKDPSHRQAVAWCQVLLAGEAVRLPVHLVESARIAGILAAKQTSTLVPLCHPLPVGEITVEISQEGGVVEIFGSASTWARTGVEMEALTTCAAAALTLIAGLGQTETAVIEALTLLEKTGGRSGSWSRRGPGGDRGTKTGQSVPPSPAS